MTEVAIKKPDIPFWGLQWGTLFSLPQLLDENEIEEIGSDHLTEVEHFGENPGNLQLFYYTPPNLPPAAPLVVVLHGCTLSAAAYDYGSGWSSLAEKEGFAVLFPQQRSENNPRRCFNWFRPNDIKRDAGEAASIRQMVAYMVEHLGIDPQQIFVTGLSAGGGMANVMLSAYPDVFAAGAIIAGLPYKAATNVHDALRVMVEGNIRTPEELGNDVRNASPFGALGDTRIVMPWPRVAVWHGLADDVVNPINGMEIIKQWADVNGLDPLGSDEDEVKGYRRMRWRNAVGELLLEAIAIEHLGHAVPIDANHDRHEHPGLNFADIGLSSTKEIARFFGLMPEKGNKKRSKI